MRVRDVITGSLDALVHQKHLPEYPRALKVNATPSGKGSPFTGEMLRTFAFGDRSHPFYRDPTAMQRAFPFVGSFKASAASRHPRPYRLLRCFGLPGAMIPLADLHLHVEEALKGLSLKVLSHNSAHHSGSLELYEQTAVEKLPHFYGIGLMDQSGREPWRDSVELRIVVDIRMESVNVGGGNREAFATLEMSAPAISLVELLQDRLPAAVSRSPSASRALLDQIEADWRRRP